MVSTAVKTIARNTSMSKTQVRRVVGRAIAQTKNAVDKHRSNQSAAIRTQTTSCDRLTSQVQAIMREREILLTLPVGAGSLDAYSNHVMQNHHPQYTCLVHKQLRASVRNLPLHPVTQLIHPSARPTPPPTNHQHHPSIMRLLGTDKTDASLYFIMEACVGGPLYRHVRAAPEGRLDDGGSGGVVSAE